MYYKKYIGENIYLSPLNENDYSLYTKWLNDETVSSAINQVSKVITEDVEKKWIISAYEKNRYNFVVVDLKEDKPLGIYGLELVNHISKRYHFVGFIGDEEYRNRGIGTEALKLLTKFAFEILNAHSLYTTIYQFNERSIKSVLKAGFVKSGVFTESVYYKLKYYDEIIFEMTKQSYVKRSEEEYGL